MVPLSQKMRRLPGVLGSKPSANPSLPSSAPACRAWQGHSPQLYRWISGVRRFLSSPWASLGGSDCQAQGTEDVVGTGMGYAHSTVTSARQQSPKARSVLSCSVRLCFLFMTRQTWAPSVPELPLLEETPRRCVLRASIRFRPRPQRRTQAWSPK